MRNIKWIELTNNNIPDREVLAIGYQDEMLIGYVDEDDDSVSGFHCSSDDTELTEVTHFIECSKLIKLLKTL